MKSSSSAFWFWLAAIIILASIARFTFLGSLPPLLLQDEASIGFNAISIAETGKDEWGKPFPLTFLSFGDNKQPVYIYATSLAYLVTGWQPALPRIPSALAGTVSVLLVALWIRKTVKSDTTALLTTLVFAVSPWTIHLSRLALEANLALMFFIGGLTALAYVQKKNRYRWLLVAALCFALSTYTYIAYRFVIVILLVCYPVVDSVLQHGWKKLNLKKRALSNSAILAFMTAALLLPSIFLAGNFTRLNQTSIITPDSVNANVFVNQGTCFLLSSSIHFPPLNLACRAIWNTKTLPLELIGQNFIQHLSPNFLFFTGDTTFNRNPTKEGMLYWFLFPIYIAGFIVAIQNFRKNILILLGWFISLWPSILTGEPHFIRMSVHLPFVVMLLALGISWSLNKFRFFTIGLLVALGGGFGFFALKYSVEVYGNSQDFLAHSQQASTTAYTLWREGKKVYFDYNLIPEPQTYIAYWNNMDPAEYQSLVGNILHEQQGFLRPTKLGDTLLFEEGDYPELFCDPEVTNTVLISHHNPTPFIATSIIRNITEVHPMVYIFDVDSIRSQDKTLAAYCRPPQP